jgi:hypothetical protein
LIEDLSAVIGFFRIFCVPNKVLLFLFGSGFAGLSNKFLHPSAQTPAVNFGESECLNNLYC